MNVCHLAKAIAFSHVAVFSHLAVMFENLLRHMPKQHIFVFVISMQHGIPDLDKD